MRITKESIIKKHSYENGEHTSYTELIEQYHYDSEEERNKHAEQMTEKDLTIVVRLKKMLVRL